MESRRNEHVAERVLRVSEAAEYLNVTADWIYTHVEDGTLPCCRLDRMIRFVLSELDGWLADNCHGLCDGSHHDGTRLMTISELELYLHVSRNWIYEARRSKRLPHYKVGALLRFSRPMVNSWLRDRQRAEESAERAGL